MDNILEESLASIVLNNHQVVPVLEKYGLDFCCRGKKTLTDACIEKGLDPLKVQEEIGSVQTPQAGRFMPFTEMSLSQMVNHIIVHHHYYVKQAMPLILSHLEKIVNKHGAHYTYMIKVRDLFSEIQNEMDLHMKKEELVLFPRITEMETGHPGYKAIALHDDFLSGPISTMEMEHEHAGDKMYEIRSLTNGYENPPGACTTFRVCLSELKNFENDLHQHVYLENNILFPGALRRASQA